MRRAKSLRCRARRCRRTGRARARRSPGRRKRASGYCTATRAGDRRSGEANPISARRSAASAICRRPRALYFFPFAHDLIQKPVPAFRDHALSRIFRPRPAGAVTAGLFFLVVRMPAPRRRFVILRVALCARLRATGSDRWRRMIDERRIEIRAGLSYDLLAEFGAKRLRLDLLDLAL